MALFDVLHEKRLGDDRQTDMDIHDWIIQHRDPAGDLGNPFLDEKYREVMRQWGLEALETA